MNYKSVIAFVFILALIGILFYIFFYYEKHNTESDEISLYVIAEYKNRPISTGVEVNGKRYETSSNYEKVYAKAGMNKITNYNLEDQNYYIEDYYLNVTGDQRIKLDLEKPLPISVKKRETENQIDLEVYSENFKGIDFCLIGSFNYMFIEAMPQKEVRFYNLTIDDEEYIQVREKYYKENEENYSDYHIENSFLVDLPYTEINIPEFFDYDRCYDGEFSLWDSFKNISIKYEEISESGPGSFINITFIDKQENTQNFRIK